MNTYLVQFRWRRTVPNKDGRDNTGATIMFFDAADERGAKAAARLKFPDLTLRFTGICLQDPLQDPLPDPCARVPG